MTTTDRELIERAAKAAGMELEWFTARVWNASIDGYEDATDGSGVFVSGSVEWDPLTDDDDEARLEGALLMNVSWGMASVTVDSCTERFSDHDGDKQKARRYAGVRAAAAMAGEGE